MTARHEAARLLALLQDQSEIERRPLEEIEEDLRLLGIDPAAATARTKRLTAGAGSAAGILMAKIAEAEEAENEIEEIGSASIEEVRARLQEMTGAGAGRGRVNGAAVPIAVAPFGSAADHAERRRGAWLSPAVIVGLLRLADAAMVLLTAIAAYLTRFHSLDEFGTLELYGGMLAAVLTTNILQVAGLYRFNQLTNLFGQSGRLLLAWVAVMLSLLALGFMTKAPLAGTSRLWVGLWFVYGFFALFSARLDRQASDPALAGERPADPQRGGRRRRRAGAAPGRVPARPRRWSGTHRRHLRRSERTCRRTSLASRCSGWMSCWRSRAGSGSTRSSWRCPWRRKSACARGCNSCATCRSTSVCAR